MRALAGFALLFALLSVDVYGDAGVRINTQGPFTDVGVWMYRTDDGKFRNGPGVKGTNESLIMPSPTPQYGEALVAITHIHHPRDRMGYPVHVSLIEKAFANVHKVQLYSSGSDDMMWAYTAGTPFGQEHGESTGSARAEAPESYKMTGPFPGNQPLPAPYADAVAYLKNALGSIENMPTAQKDLSNYVVLFSETDAVIWMEIAPVPAAGEDVHLGCQMQNGRDMVFGYEKNAAAGKHGGPWLQCF